ncbi:MAG: hypothetical protein ABIP06_11565, partial [Pyrinomonadaceae bacterium]
KRFFPFLLTFAAGLLIASFFVTVAAPNFQFNRGGKFNRFRYLKNENQRLKQENERLKRELAERQAVNSIFEFGLDVPPPPMPPMPPKPPVAPGR